MTLLMKTKRTNASNMNAWETDSEELSTFPLSSCIYFFRKSFHSMCHDLKAKANVIAENDISKK